MTKHSPAITHPALSAYRRRAVLWAALLALFVGMVAYAAGLREQGYRLQAVQADKERLLDEVADLRNREYRLRLQVANLQSDQAVDAQALRGARNTIAELEQRKAELESDLGFYRSIMAPSDAQRGFRVDRFELRSTGDDRVWDYSLVVTQVGNNDRFLSGHIDVTIQGEASSESVSLVLHEVADNVEPGGIKYRFRYFQTVEGRLRLPKGFSPEQIRLQVNARNRGEPLLEETRQWSDLLPAGALNS